jgi:type II secretory pathway pseudopilin PulG
MHGREGGFSLLEVVFAAAIFTAAVVAVAQLLAVSTRANSNAKATTVATCLAEGKMEQLRSLIWAFDILGLPLTDTTTDLAAVLERPAGGRGLTPAHADSLSTNVDGYFDVVDPYGRALSGVGRVPEGAAYIRRWSIEPLRDDPANALVLQVLVVPAKNAAAGRSTTAGRMPDEARIVTVRTRRTQ